MSGGHLVARVGSKLVCDLEQSVIATWEQEPPCTRRRRGLRIVRPDRKRQGSFTPSLLLSHDDPLRWARHGALFAVPHTPS